MPSPLRIPKRPVALAFALWRIWWKLPPRQRREVLAAARRHGPRVASLAAATASRTARERVARRPRL
ncbi:MAG TPA: hypothetical protein VFR43_06750 [Gaiellaceae bacterium]|nr:hypothetical protein [Gaiellaceae bacterium]